jgi:hypothetical protein
MPNCPATRHSSRTRPARASHLVGGSRIDRYVAVENPLDEPITPGRDLPTRRTQLPQLRPRAEDDQLAQLNLVRVQIGTQLIKRGLDGGRFSDRMAATFGRHNTKCNTGATPQARLIR